MSETIVRDRYRLLRVIGEGGAGKVWQAEDLQTGQTVAVKQVNVGQSSEAQTELRRFEREAHLLRELEHPNIVKVWAFFEEEKRRYLVMSFMEQGSLYQTLKHGGPFPIARVRQIGIDLCYALMQAHSLGIIHRDIKPENVLLDRDGNPVLTDFGLARLKEGTSLTEAGYIVGSLSHISPEVCTGKKADERSDIWSLGMTLYELLTGKAPFERNDLQATVTAILTEPLPPLGSLRPDAPPEMVEAIHAMLVKDPIRRIPDMRGVAAALERVPVGGGARKKRKGGGWLGRWLKKIVGRGP